MPTLETLFATAHISGALIAATAAIIAWRQRAQPGSLPLALLMLSVFVWAVSAIAKTSLKYLYPWAAVEILGAGISAVLYLVFILEYVRQENLIRKRTLLFLLIIPIVSALLALTEPQHSLFWKALPPPPPGPPGWNINTPNLFFVFLLYYYALRLVGTTILASNILSLSKLSSAQSWTLIAGAIAPWLSNIVYAVLAPSEQFTPDSLELHPLAYALSGLILGWGILRYRLFEIVPLAHDLVMEHLRDIIITLDTNNHIVDLNKPGQQLFGVEIKAVFGKPVEKAFNQFPALIAFSIHGSQPEQLYFPDLCNRYYEAEAIPIIDRQGTPRGRIIVLHDITARKKTEEDLRREHAQLQLIFDYAGMGIRISNRDGRYSFVNDRWAEMLGKHPNELIGQIETDFLHVNDIHYNRQVQQELLEGEISHYHIENRYRGADGKFFWGEISVSPTFNANGEIEAVIGFIIDISKRKQAEMALRETERRFRDILENIQLLAVMLDVEGNITFCNNFFQSITGLQRADILGRNWFSNFVNADEQVRAEFSRAIKRGAIVSRHENYVYNSRSERRLISWSNIALKDETGQTIGMASIGEDITARRQAHEAEREQRILAESLTNTAANLTSSLNFGETLKLILENVGKVVPHDAANISLIEGKLVRFVRTQGYEEMGITQQMLEALHLPYKSSYNLNKMFEEKQPIVIPDTSTDPNWKVFPEAEWVKSYLGVPIIVHEKVVGFINLDSGKSGFFKEFHTQRLAAFSVQAAIAIENARLFEKSQHELNERRKAQSRLRRANKNLEKQLAEIEALQSKLREQVIRDPLTGLYNRRYLDETLEREVARAERDDLPIAILMFDIDYFKKINDTYGHEAGDLMLKSLAGLLLKESRRSDVACRFGGEEFCIVMPGAPLAIAQRRAEIWRRTFGDLKVTYKNHTLSATVSVGIAIYPEHGLSGGEVMNKADQALYTAKQSGRNRVNIAPFTQDV